MLEAGALLGPYEILSRIGAGGMGEVYKARDTRLNRTVAIKISKEQFSERFEREARAVAALNHPHICTLYDIGPNYLVMEYIEGKPLQGPMRAERAIRLATEIARALEAAHDKGITHRDLKPANILETSNGVKLLDFGLAKINSDLAPDDITLATSLTIAGALLGTPAYMAPEQRDGKPADARSDIYALGAVIYEMVTGKRADRERASLPHAALNAIVLKCMAGDPDERYQSAAELRGALGTAIGGNSRVKYGIVATGVVVAIVAVLVFLLSRSGASVGTRNSTKDSVASPAAGDSTAKSANNPVGNEQPPAGNAAEPVKDVPLLTDQDVLVVADFDNKTGDPVFDAALRQALAFHLEQSPFLKAMDEVLVREAMTLSGHPPTAAVTPVIARDACLRQGAKATLEGAITAIGSTYLLALQAVHCRSGKTLAREQAQAADKEHVVEALGKATALMRQKLGESLSNVRGEKIVYPQSLSTSSLEALEAFRLADQEYASGSSIKAIPHLLRATELDPYFAMAFSVASVMYQNVNDMDKAREYDAKAYALLGRVKSERERLFITSEHYRFGEADVKKLTESREVLVQTYPRDPIFHGNLANSYNRNGQFEKAAREAEAEIQQGPHISQGYGIAVSAYIQLGRAQDAKRILEKAIAQHPDIANFHAQRLYVAYVEGDGQRQEKELKWLAGKPETATLMSNQIAENALALGQPHKAREAFGNNLPPAAATRIAMLETGRTPPPPDPIPANANGMVVYASGQALLAKDNAKAAVAEFQKILNNKLRYWGPFYPLAYVGMARAETKAGNAAQARKAYETFFALWKDAEPDVPVLIEARKEFAALK